MAVVQVAAAILYQEGKILICKRAAGKESCAGLWEFPGGKLEAGESPEQCVQRECQEELGVSVRIRELVEIANHHYPEREVQLFFYSASIESGEPVSRVHPEIRWVTPRELGTFAFCPADQELIRKLSSI